MTCTRQQRLSSKHLEDVIKAKSPLTCPNCGADYQAKVIDNGRCKTHFSRRRECALCGERWTSYELTESALEVLLERSEFAHLDRQKLVSFKQKLRGFLNS